MTTTTGSVTGAVWAALARVADPEIPAVSVVDMGMIKKVEVAGSTARITILPTFTGCPAVPIIKEDVERAVSSLEEIEATVVDFSFEPPWTSDRITEEGRSKLAAFGLAPPTGKGPVLITDIGLPKAAICPFCASKNTSIDNPFGPTPCRSLYYCNACRNPFEQFKPV